MKIIFMGTPDFAKESLEALYNAGHEIALVVTNPDRPKGRGMKMIASPVKEFCLEKEIEVIQPEKVKSNDEVIQKIKRINADVICVVAYGKILPIEILSAAKYGSINVHGSLLPKYRGAAPIQWAIINGEKETGVTTMFMNEKMDEGNILLEEKVDINQDETLGELWNRLSIIGGNLLLETLKKLENDSIKQRVQDEKQATYAPMLKKEISKIDWQIKTARQIKDLVRGLDPIMGAYTMLGDIKLKIWKVGILNLDEFVEKFSKEFAEFYNRLKKLEPGTIIYATQKDGMYVKAIDDILLIKEIQAPNAKRMNISDFLGGNQIQAGTILE